MLLEVLIIIQFSLFAPLLFSFLMPIWMLQEFREKYAKDTFVKTLNSKTLKYHPMHPRLHYSYKTLIRDLDRPLVLANYHQGNDAILEMDDFKLEVMR